MPFIKGRYHVNPTMGEALEAAREAEAAMRALQRGGRPGASDTSSDRANPGDDANPNDDPNAAVDANGPIHRVEIEAAEVVPSHSGRAARGFVARVHRAPAQADDSSPAPRYAASRTDGWRSASDSSMPPAETHVFSDHRDLVSFLRDELAKDCRK
jgi:hypothetical protein